MLICEPPSAFAMPICHVASMLYGSNSEMCLVSVPYAFMWSNLTKQNIRCQSLKKETAHFRTNCLLLIT